MSNYLKSPNFLAGRQIVDPKTGTASAEFTTNLNTMLQNIRSAISDLQAQETNISNALTQAGIAVSDASSATSSTAALSHGSYLATSYVSPTSIITSTQTTGTASIVIADHHRVYGDGSSVAVTGATIGGLAVSTTYWIYYTDSARAGGSVSYQTTTNNINAVQHNDTHCVGRITTPATGSTTTAQGGGTVGPGIEWYASDFGN